MASKSKRRGRVFRASCILAALIIAGSSFAWFTSKDEVTNRLSANANYGAAIVEDFTPPENLLPGQKVNKDVGVVNTGNIDAIVKTHLKGAINILKENAVANELDVLDSSSFTAPNTPVTDVNLKALGLTFKDSTDNFYRTLSVKERTNPQAPSDANDPGLDDGAVVESPEVNEYSEVEAIQAGGYLAYASGAFKFTPETAGYTYRNSGNTETITQTAATELTSAAIKNTWDGSDGAVGLKIDSDTFEPTSAGLFIFRRDVTEDATNGTYYEYTGYYFDGSNYLALHYLPNEGGTKYKSDYVIYSTKEAAETSGTVLSIGYEGTTHKTPVVKVAGTTVKLFSASYTRVEDVTGVYNQGTIIGANVDKAPTVTFTYDGGTANTDDDIKVVVYLDNVGVKAASDNAETWTEKDQNSVPYFYYNNDVEEGDTTAKLVDSVELDKNTKKSAYLAMDFDLSVLLDSIQVTYDEDGKEVVTAANDAWNDSVATATYDSGSNEIKSISWTAPATNP